MFPLDEYCVVVNVQTFQTRKIINTACGGEFNERVCRSNLKIAVIFYES